MNTIKPDFVRQKWQYKPEFATADTSSLSNVSNTITTCVSVPYMASEIQRRVDQIYKEHEAEMNGMSNIQFNDLERELHELGIKLSTIRHSSGDVGCEIEGYLRPDIYKIHRVKERCSVPISPKKPIPKKVKFSGPATIILWEDGTKTVVKCQKEDVWSDEVGIVMCYMKKMLGNKGNFNNIFREAMKVAEVHTKKEELVINKDAKKILEKIPHFDSAYDAVPEDYNFVEGNYEEETK